MNLEFSWNAIEGALQRVGEASPLAGDQPIVAVLRDLGLVDFGTPAELTPLGDRYFLARFVLEDKDDLQQVLSDMLSGQAVPQAFCAALWGSGELSVTGALNLLRRLGAGDDEAGRRWLTVMNRAGWIVYNAKHPKTRVLHNSQPLVSADEDAQRERTRAHLISPETPFGNLLALREMIRAARVWIWWYEQHLPAKALEVLYREVDGEDVDEIRLLSGPANVDVQAKDDFKRFAKEMKSRRGVVAEWRVLSKKEAFQRHDRFFLSEDLARNLPPLNTVLAGSTGEILPSDLTHEDFLAWWSEGTPIAQFQIPSAPGS